jgi:predicted lipoprotein with Yx(FWY)xxD motif
MKKFRLLLAVFAAISLVATGAAFGQSAHTSSASTVVTTKSTSLGVILASGGKTLYTNMSGCGGGCLQIWPALKAKGTLKATGKAKAADLGKRNGQVTYKGHPLYTFSTDPTGTSGEASNGFYVVSPSGSLITHAAKTGGSSTTSSSW